MTMLGLLRRLLFVILSAAVLLVSAGRWDLPLAWIYICTWAVYALAGSCNEQGAQLNASRDWLAVIMAQLLFWAVLIVAGLDVGRFHWSDTVPMVIQVGGVILCILSLGLISWSRAVNRFFSSVIRIQQDRGHRAITVGPYQYIRHPGYAGMVIFNLASAVALGSWWSLLPSMGRVFLTLRRTALEDRVLQEELQDYADYAKRVRYRLIPGLW